MKRIIILLSSIVVSTPALAVGDWSGTIRVDHFGFRPADDKIAVLLGNGGATVEVRRSHDDSVAETYVASAESTDQDSGDTYATVDFSPLSETGSFYMYVPSLDHRSYDFGIADDVYDIVGMAAVKSFYFQRCNHDKALPYASDALGSFTASGRQWVDGVCHASDHAATAGPSCPDHGALDLGGGWHDAGDYQKTLWGRAVMQMLWAYELNPTVWGDGQLTIPEAGNGIVDILDEAAWELDFYVRMQRPDGHFMTSVKGQSGGVASPPSANNQTRVYFDCTSPSGGNWSGGGCTIVEATGHATAVLAHAATLFEATGATSKAATYRQAALAGWSWLAANAGSEQRQVVCMAAAATYRLDGTVTSARDRVEGFPWASWDGELPSAVSPGTRWLTAAAWHYLLSPVRDAGVESTIREAVRQAVVARAFDERGVYGGLYGNSSNGWDWSWGSNSSQGMYGSNLLIADRLGIRDGHTSDEMQSFAQTYLHYLLGRNPLNMVYMTNMATYGGEHSSFQIYHSWFSYTGDDGDHGNANYNGKPTGVVEPLYPYYVDDTQTSINGPAPGIVPGGPNWYYSGTYDIPNRTYPAYAYRDWSVACDWDGSDCRAKTWEISEPDTRYQGPLVLLVSFFMSPFTGGTTDGAPPDDGGQSPDGAPTGDDLPPGDNPSATDEPTGGDDLVPGDDSNGGDSATDLPGNGKLTAGCACRTTSPLSWVAVVLCLMARRKLRGS